MPIHQSWEENAPFWDSLVGFTGNPYWRLIQQPALERLVPVTQGCKALDLATGNGIVARWLAAKGAEVHAADGSSGMVDHAKERGTPEGKQIQFHILDATVPAHFDAFLQNHNGFDLVTCHMALMDISDLELMAAALPKLLKQNGIFYATTLHPVFITSGATKWVETVVDPETGKYYNTHGRTVREYRSKKPWRGVAANEQPSYQLYYHRPMDVLLKTFLKAGLVIDEIEELYFDEKDANSERPISTVNFTQLPVILAFRMRKL